jgi:GNAT superfamily N-acetyltransferase
MDDRSSREPDAPPESRVRPAVAADVPDIWRVHNDSIRELCGQRYGPEEITAWIAFRPPDAYLQALASRALFVAEWQGAIVGFGQLDPARAEIEACYVAPEAVGSGIGSALLARMEDEARRRGHRVVRLNATLNAEKFYVRQGYRWLGRASHRVSADIDLPCVRMEKAL